MILHFSDTRPDSFSILARFYLLLVLTLILPFFGTHTDSTLFRYSVGTIFRYSHGFYLFPVLARILPFFGTHTDWTLFQCSPKQFSGTRTDSTFLLARILPFLDSHMYWTFFRYSPAQFVDARTNSTFSRYSLGFYHFSVLTLIGPFSGTRPIRFPILARILPFPDTHTDSTIFRYSH